MKRICLFTMIAVLSLAQRSRDQYRAAYRAWRQTDPNLEREAAAGGVPVARRADRMAAEAAKAEAARKAYLESAAQDEAQHIRWLESVDHPGESTAASTTADARFTSYETSALTRTIDKFAADPDRGIQQLRQTLEHERTALEALVPLIAQRKKAAESVTATAAAIEQARAKALEQSRVMLQGLQAASADTAGEAAAWAEYYRKLGDAVVGPATPITQVQPGAEPATLNNPIPAPPSVTPLPITRYVGAWTFPQSGGVFHGIQPESVDLLVREENGRAVGSVFARFKLPTGNTGDPVLRFNFTGAFQSSRRQAFELITTDGAKGTIELIPGPAFNLLEMNFQTEPMGGKVRQADMLLVKK